MIYKQSIFIDPVEAKKDIRIVGSDISALKDYLRKHPKELYATPQMIDQENPKMIVVLRTFTDKKESLITMLNPQILERSDKVAVEETQSGVEGTYLNIRHPQITVAYLALPKVDPIHITLKGKAAIMFQQAYSLLQGISIDLLGLRIDNYEEYKNGDEEQRQTIIAQYIQDLKSILEQAKEEDTEINEYVRASEFMKEKIDRSVKSEIRDSQKENKE